jgi:hypothetical protein
MFLSSITHGMGRTYNSKRFLASLQVKNIDNDPVQQNKLTNSSPAWERGLKSSETGGGAGIRFHSELDYSNFFWERQVQFLREEYLH